ncbi:MAG: ribulose-phosphate 3-epimerase [Elusimicrobiota bacterium]
MAARKPVIVPSLLAADHARLGESIDALKSVGCEWVSVDVMDGRFVPNLSFGPEHVAMAKRRGVTVDAHLMVDNPERVAPWFVKAGADIVTFHWEACQDAAALLREIRRLGAKAGIAVKPATLGQEISSLVAEADLILVMTVEPGFGGALFMDRMLPKVEFLRATANKSRADCWIQVDGGITVQTASRAVAAGADSLVAGSSIFGSADPAGAYKDLVRSAVESSLASNGTKR